MRVMVRGFWVRLRRGVWLWFFPWLFVTGCQNGGLGQPCKRDADCLSGLVCQKGHCASEILRRFQNAKVTLIEGDGTSSPIVFSSGQAKPSFAKMASRRFRSRWTIHGEHLDVLTGVSLVSERDPKHYYGREQGFQLLQGGNAVNDPPLKGRACESKPG